MPDTARNPKSIPTIDLAAFASADAAGRRRIGAQVDETCRRVGFVVVRGHGLAPELVDRVVDDAYRFYDLPAERKARYMPSGAAKQRGYTGFATRRLAKTLGVETPADLREQVFLGPIDDHRAHYAHIAGSEIHYAPNIIPDEPPGFAASLAALYRGFEGVARQMFRLFAAALRIEEDHFDALMSRHFSIFGLSHYPPLAAPPLPGQLRVGAHTDFGAMTILAMTEAVGGLEARLPDGSWEGVQPRRGELVVNLGDMMARWTNDAWASTLHRVANPPGVNLAESRRISIGFFVHPNYDAPVACIPTCLAPGERPRYPTITAGEHIAMKIARSQQAS